MAAGGALPNVATPHAIPPDLEATNARRKPLSISHPSAIGWILPLWWLTTTRRWKHHGGALLISFGAAVLLTFGWRSAPAGGQPLYLTILLLLATGAIVGSPLILSTESFLSSSRLALLPLSGVARSVARLLLGNSLRVVLAVVTFGWGAFAIAFTSTDGPALTARLLHLSAWIALAMILSLIIEDYIRLRRGVIVHQLIFLTGLSLWPLLIEYLRDESNFVPGPVWAAGAGSTVLFTGPASVAQQLALAALFLAIAFLLLGADERLVTRYSGRAPRPPSSARWTAAIARSLAGRRSEFSPLFKELLIPLRFIFLRMTLVFIALSAVAAFALGLPPLLLSIPFWWQSLSTNLLGPDVGDGELRYSLVGIPAARMFRWRLLAMVVLSIVVVALVATVAVVTGWAIMPRVGPASPLAYLAASIYGISLLPLWSIGGDRYSVRYADGLEMHTLLPDRTRSGGAGAVVILLILWAGTFAIAAALVAVAAAVVLLISPGPLDAGRLLAIASMASIANIAAYLIHTRPGTK